jgi:hypothetical protein
MQREAVVSNHNRPTPLRLSLAAFRPVPLTRRDSKWLLPDVRVLV